MAYSHYLAAGTADEFEHDQVQAKSEELDAMRKLQTLKPSRKFGLDYDISLLKEQGPIRGAGNPFCS